MPHTCWSFLAGLSYNELMCNTCIRANHSKGWDAKLLAYVPRVWDRVAEPPGEHSTSSALCLSHGPRNFLEAAKGVRKGDRNATVSASSICTGGVFFMLLSTSAHTLPPALSSKTSMHQTFAVLLFPLQLLHLLCILGFPLLTVGYVGWLLATGSWSPASLSVALHALLATPTPWQALGILGAAYSTFIWLLYVLPVWARDGGHARMVRECRFPAPMLWKHVTLWGLTFGPLLHYYETAADLSLPLVGLVLAGLVWGFYEIVWQDLRWVQQRRRETARVFRRHLKMA